jgi:hypothetical protein
MRKSRYTEGQIAFALKQAETGTPVSEVTRKTGITEKFIFAGRRSIGGSAPPNSGASGSSKKRTANPGRWWSASASTNTCSRKSSKKVLKPAQKRPLVVFLQDSFR